MSFIFTLKIPKAVYFLCAAVIAAACVLSLALLPARNVTSFALAGRTVVIDPGHGGFDPGVLGCTVSVEKDINLQVSLQLAQLLREGGAEVLLLREDDRALAGSKAEDLAARVAIAEAAGADIYLSLHCNAYQKDSPWYGAQCFYHSANEGAAQLAAAIQQSLRETLQNTEREALPHDTTFILKHLSMPAVIVEMGFLSNREEEAELLDAAYRGKMAMAIYVAVCSYFSSEP